MEGLYVLIILLTLSGNICILGNTSEFNSSESSILEADVGPDKLFRNTDLSNTRTTGFSVNGGPSHYEGNVFYNGAPICDDSWDDTDAIVFCRMFGYQNGTATLGSTYGQVSSDFSMDDVRCTGSETSLLDCPHVTQDNCGSHEGAGVICSGFSINGGPSHKEGNVFYNGAPICDDSWDDTDAIVFCRMFGYQNGTATLGSTYGQVSSDFSMDDVQCTGSETSLLDCPHVTQENCGSHEGAGVICSGFSISGGPSVNEGNVFYNDTPICDDGWGNIEAGVFCRMFGYQDGTATHGSTYGQVSSDFSMDDVHCNGNELSLLHCHHLTYDNCGSHEGAGVICSDTTSTTPSNCPIIPNCPTMPEPVTCPIIPSCATPPEPSSCPPTVLCPTILPPASCPATPTCPTPPVPLPTASCPTCPATPSCPTPPVPSPTPSCPTSTCPATLPCPTISAEEVIISTMAEISPTCHACPTIPDPPTCPPTPVCPSKNSNSTINGTCFDTGCKNAFNGLGICVDTKSADFFNTTKTIDFTAGTKDGKCSRDCNCNCFKHTGCYSDLCDANNGICLIPEQEENRGFFIPYEYEKAFPCDESLNCFCYIRNYVGITTPSAGRATSSCKPNKRCTKKKGTCFGRRDAIPTNAVRRGWCDKKKGCKCYKV